MIGLDNPDDEVVQSYNQVCFPLYSVKKQKGLSPLALLCVDDFGSMDKTNLDLFKVTYTYVMLIYKIPKKIQAPVN